MSASTDKQHQHVRIGHTALTWDPFSDPHNLLRCIEDAADAGFLGIETGGLQVDALDEENPKALGAELRARQISMACLFQFGAWTQPADHGRLLEHGKHWAERVQELGGDLLMLVPGERQPAVSYGWSSFEIMAEAMNRVGEAAQRAGARCAVHPHWGTVVETRLEIDTLLHLLDPSLVGFAPDSGQIAKGGTDPLQVLGDWVDLVQHVHLKDVSKRWPELRRQGIELKSAEGYAVLGEGSLDLPSFLDALGPTSFDGWIMAELDQADRPARDVAFSHADFLRAFLSRGNQEWEIRAPTVPAAVDHRGADERKGW